MQVTLTCKVQVRPDEAQARSLSNTQRAYVAACNKVSSYAFDNQTLRQSELQGNLYYRLREEFGLPSQITQSAIRSVISAYKTIHASNKKWSSKAEFKKHTADLVWNKDYSVTKDGQLSISTLDGRVKVDTDWSGPIENRLQGKFGTAKLTNKHGKWLLHIPVTLEIDDPLTPTSICGVDMGLRFLATTYDEKTVFYSGKEVKRKREKYKKLRSELQSKGTRSAKRRLKAIGSRENRWMTDVNHCLSKALMNRNDPTLFVLEDLAGIRKATEKVAKKNRYTQVSWAFYQLRLFIEYKAPLYGHTVIAVDPRFTSQACPKCGHTCKDNRNGKLHVFKCVNCGYSSNDDRIGAMNLHRLGIQYQVQLSCGQDPQLTGQRQLSLMSDAVLLDKPGPLGPGS